MMITKKTKMPLAILLVIIFILTATVGCTSAGAEDEKAKIDSAEIPEGIIPNEISVPDAVLAAAKDYVIRRYQSWSISTGHYKGTGEEREMIGEPASFDNWRIEGLSYVYSYQEIDGRPVSAYQQSADEHWQSVDVYRLNYRLHTTTPEKAQLLLAGGMDLDEEGWLLPTYPDSTYLFFAFDGSDERFLFTMMENDCSPGSELFTNDLKESLLDEKNGSASVNSELSEIVCVYKNAVEAYAWFALSALETSNDAREYNGASYNKVTDDRFKTLADLESHLHAVFSDSIVSDLLHPENEPEPYCDIDGELYAIPAERGSDITKGEEKYGIVSKSADKIVFRVTVEILEWDDDDEKTVTGYETYDFPYEKIGDRWVFTTFDLVR